MGSNPHIRLLVISGDPESIRQLRLLVKPEQGIEIIGHAVAALEAIQLATQQKPDVLCLDLASLGVEGIAIGEAIAARLPEARVVMILPPGKTDADLLRRAMRAGAEELLIRPFTAQELAESVYRAQRLNPKLDDLIEAHKDHAAAAHSTALLPRQPAAPAPLPPAAERQGQGEVLTVFSASGGVGCSTLAVNLAVALKALTQARVALVDANLRFGDVGILLNLRGNRSMVDLCGPAGVDLSQLESVMITHYSGLRVLQGPLSPEFGEMVTPAALHSIVGGLRERFDYVVVDTHSFLDEAVLRLLDVSDKILLLTTSELPAMKNTKLFLHVGELLNYAPEKTLMIVNRHNSKGRIAPADIEASIRHPVYAVIERDDKVTTEAVQTGQPFTLQQKSTPLSRSIYKLATRLSAPAAEPRAQAERKLPWSFVRRGR